MDQHLMRGADSVLVLHYRIYIVYSRIEHSSLASTPRVKHVSSLNFQKTDLTGWKREPYHYIDFEQIDVAYVRQSSRIYLTTLSPSTTILQQQHGQEEQ